MRKLFLISLVLLLAVGIANATNIQTTTEPKNFPTVWTEQVYNGSGSTITSGYVVQWDFDSADSSVDYYDDMCPYVKLNATDEGVWQAGVLPYGQDISNGSTGAIIVKGPAYVLIGSTCTVNQLVAADTAGKASPFDGGADDEGVLGVCIKATQAGTAGPDGGASSWTVVYVDPMRWDDV